MKMCGKNIFDDLEWICSNPAINILNADSTSVPEHNSSPNIRLFFITII